MPSTTPFLCRTYGKRLIQTPYQTRLRDTDEVGFFEGQTALHLAIVNQVRRRR
jgi:hypothetical protein